MKKTEIPNYIRDIGNLWVFYGILVLVGGSTRMLGALIPLFWFFGAFIIYTGISFHSVKPWSRRVLKVLTWVFLMSELTFLIGAASLIWGAGTPFVGNTTLALTAVISIVVVGIPLGFVTLFLSRDEVKKAIKAAEQTLATVPVTSGADETPSR